MNPYQAPTENKPPGSPRSGKRSCVMVLLGALMLIAFTPYPAMDFAVGGFAGAYIWSQFNSKFAPMMIAGFVGSALVLACMVASAFLQPLTGNLIGSFHDLLAIPLLCLYSMPGTLLAFMIVRRQFKTRNNKIIAG